MEERGKKMVDLSLAKDKPGDIFLRLTNNEAPLKHGGLSGETH